MKNCWEYTNCGRIPGGHRVEEKGVCPAYPDHGDQCARYLEPGCGRDLEKLLEVKLHQCPSCEFYFSDHYKPRDEDFGRCARCGALIEKDAGLCAKCR